eukprot:6207009-Pleurochrysis_carterae.AAC.3
MGELKQVLEVEKEEAVLAAKAAGAAATAQAVLEVKDLMVKDAVSDPYNLCRHSKDIFNAGLKPFASGDMLRYEPIGFKDGKIHRRGRYKYFLGITKAGKADVSRKHWKTRSKELSAHMGVIAGGAQNVSKLITVHQKSNRQLYQQIGVMMEKKLSVEQTAALCNETSGTLGAAMRRHLTDCGINVATKKDVQDYFRSSWHECETGRITVPHPKRRGHILTGAWLRVSDLQSVIQCAMQKCAAKGELAWPSNISGQECWFQLIIDKGSSATKIVLKYNCISFPESVRNVSLVGMLDRVKDTYEMMSIFRPLFDQFNEINQRGLCVWSPWQQLLPSGIKASAIDAHPIHDFVVEQSATAAPTSAVPASVLPAPPFSSAPTYPDCRSCAKWGARCPSKLRRSHASNGEGNVKMDLCFGEGPGLIANTWSVDCMECQADEGGQLQALRRQWEEVRERGPGWRRLRGMLGGDWLSISVPLGLGGPKNKQFCMVCLASLHDTNAANVPHVPYVSVCGLCTDPRPPHFARPRLRAGTASIAAQAAAYASAVEQHAAGDLNRKPEPANFDSCVEQPLVWAGRHMLDLISCTPLHFMLGITVDLVNCLEWELKAYDATLRREFLDGQLAEELNSLAAEASRLKGEVLRWEGHLAHHRGSIEVIEATEGAAEAIKLGKKPPKRGRNYVPLPLESEYRSHLREVCDAESKLEQLATAIDTLQRKVVKVSSEDPGPFAQSFIDTMNQWNFQRQAYHSGALVGNDCQKVLQPHVTAALTDLLRPRLVPCDPLADAYDEEDARTPYQILGSHARADAYASLLADFSILCSLFMRKAALCSHQIQLFSHKIALFAARYANMFPGKKPPPKVHGMNYHMRTQMDRLGTTGMLSESAVESMHVIDNRMVARYASVKNMEEQLRCRARAIWQLTNPNAVNIREADNANAARKRERHAAGHRMRRLAESSSVST